jgi:hypothetical protein
VIYFIFDARSNAVKVGQAGDPKARLRALQTAHAGPLELVATMPGEIHVEQKLHHQFAELRIRGEWFQFTGALAEFVGELRWQRQAEREWRSRAGRKGQAAKVAADRGRAALARPTTEHW